MWQKCPICNGTGYVKYSGCGDVKCTVCDGKKIINEITGKPPSNRAVEYPLTPKDCFVGPGPKGYFSDYNKHIRDKYIK